MPTRTKLLITLAACTLAALAMAQSRANPADPLPSWNDTETKRTIIGFVRNTTREGSSGFIEPSERIATFDNDGTLWAEQPMYFQLLFAVDRVKAMAPQHPEWKSTEPFASVLEGDVKGALAQGEKAIVELIAATHAGMTSVEFDAIVKDWIETARHPVSKRPYTEMVYKPMLELLDYLRENGFKTYIVSGGGVEFMRAFAEHVYGIPPEQVIGSAGKTEYELRSGVPVIVKLPGVEFIDDKEGKPVAIARIIGRRPVIAFGNSDGDLQMLQYTTIPRDDADATPRLGAFIHHTDADREWAYDRGSHIGALEKGLDEANRRGWLIVDMKKDWASVFP